MNTKVHVFETAGLGKAPFKFVGYYVDRGRTYTTPQGLTVTVGAPGQPTGTCDYCTKNIAHCFQIESADGKKFVVGSECVMKTGDAGLKGEVNKVKTILQHNKQDEIIQNNWVWVEANKSELEKMPSHTVRHSMYSMIVWYYKNAGRAGKIRIVKVAMKAMEAA
jgi:hypothetical protein